jgi:hypothetical protein
MINIDGSRGHGLKGLRNKFPKVEDKFVLPDLQLVIDGIEELHGDIERMKYDFFTP